MDQADQQLQIEPRRQPSPLLPHTFQAARQELTHAEHLLDHGKRTFARVTPTRILLLSFVRFHQLSLLNQMRRIDNQDSRYKTSVIKRN